MRSIIDFPKTEWADSDIGQHRTPAITMAEAHDEEKPPTEFRVTVAVGAACLMIGIVIGWLT